VAPADRLRQAIETSGLSLTEVARRLAGPGADDRQVKAKRRQLQKYLRGDHQPSPATALALSRIIAVDASELRDERAVGSGWRRQVETQLGEIWELLDRLKPLLDDLQGHARARGGKE